MLLITQQHGLGRWEPAALPRKLQQLEAGDAAAARAAAQEGGGSKAAEVYEAQRQLPGLQRAVRREAQEGSGLPDLEALKRFPEDEMRVPRKPEPVLTEWDLRAKMEKRRRHERETAGAGGGGVGRGWAGRAGRMLPCSRRCLSASLPSAACSLLLLALPLLLLALLLRRMHRAAPPPPPPQPGHLLPPCRVERAARGGGALPLLCL